MKRSRLVTTILVCAICALAFLFFTIPPLGFHVVRSPVSVAKGDMRSISTALEAYFVDNNSYPPCGAGLDGVNYRLSKDNPAFDQPTFHRYQVPGMAGRFAALTTPVAFISKYPLDPFVKKKATFAYYTAGGKWIIWSPGPDGEYDLDPQRDWNPKSPQPSPQLLIKEYDPTNGAKSGGDIFRVRG